MKQLNSSIMIVVRHVENKEDLKQAGGFETELIER
jgi:hypothetical protein